MESFGDAQEATGVTVDQAAESIAALLTREGDSEGGETEAQASPDQAEAPEETDGAEAEVEQSEAEETEETEEQPQTYRVKAGGEEVEVTLDELQRGYSRMQDYTAKTMQLGEERKAFDAEKQATAQERAYYGQAVEQLRAALERIHADDPVDENLRWTDPGEYAARKQEQADRQRQIDNLKAEEARVAGESRAEEDQRLQAKAAEEERALLAALPEWADPEKARQEWSGIVEYAQSRGVQPEEMQRLMYDHRLVLALRDAAAYRALKAKTPKIAEQVSAVKAAKPGAPVRPVTDLTRSKQRLAKTGRVEDAAAAIERILR